MDQEREIGQAESDRIHIVSLQVTALQEVFSQLFQEVPNWINNIEIIFHDEKGNQGGNLASINIKAWTPESYAQLKAQSLLEFLLNFVWMLFGTFFLSRIYQR